MKRITIGFFLLSALATSVNAQDYKKVRQPFLIAQVAGANGGTKLEEAKAEIDKIAADAGSQNKAETYLLQAEIYGSIAGNEALSTKYPNANTVALNALNKYLQLEPSEEKLKEDKYIGVNQIYSSLFNEGVKYYNAKSWDSAYNKFKDLAALGDTFTIRKWSTSAFDTTSYLYAGVTAQNAKKSEEAAKYYGVIAEHKIKGTDYESIYDYLTKYHLNANNQEQFNKYLALAKEAYPDNTIWAELEFANMSDNASVAEVEKKYNDEDAAKTLTASQYQNYGDYFINNKKVKDLDEAQKAVYALKAFESFKKAAALEPESGVAAYNAGISAYNIYENASDKRIAIKGTTPAIKAKQAEADKVSDAAADEAIEWLEKGYKLLDAKADKDRIEKNSQTTSAKLLAVLYNYKRERSKGKAADYDKYDAKFKFYDTKY